MAVTFSTARSKHAVIIMACLVVSVASVEHGHLDNTRDCDQRDHRHRQESCQKIKTGAHRTHGASASACTTGAGRFALIKNILHMLAKYILLFVGFMNARRGS